MLVSANPITLRGIICTFWKAQKPLYCGLFIGILYFTISIHDKLLSNAENLIFLVII